jgi:hypothetical protein
MNKTIKKEFLPGGARRQELLDQVPNYLKHLDYNQTNICFVLIYLS